MRFASEFGEPALKISDVVHVVEFIVVKGEVGEVEQPESGAGGDRQ